MSTSQAVAAGIVKPTFYLYVKEKGLERMAHGIFLSPDAWADSMYVLHLRCEQAIFSHDTALFFHDLTDREPMQYTITVKTGYNPTKLKADGIQVYTVKKELQEVGRTMAKTSFGHEVPVYDMERTICDLIRNLSKEKSADAQILMRNYMMERFLERISLSDI